MKNCHPNILAHGPNFSITNCARCKRIGVFYNNLLIGYTHADFTHFSKNFAKIIFNDHAVTFPDGSSRIIVKTPHKDIQLNLNLEEFEALKDHLQASMLLIQAYSLIG